MEEYGMNLQLFGEAAGGADAGAAAPGEAAPEETAPNVQQSAVDTGATDADAGRKKPTFAEMIRGEYKQDFDKTVSGIVQARLARYKDAAKTAEAAAPLLEMLGERYGVKANDIDALTRALEEDTSFYEQEALEKGIPLEQLREFKRLERQTARLQQQLEEKKRQEAAADIYSGWQRQAEEAKAYYQEFDLDAETANPQFVQLLQAGVDVRTAYEVVHKDEIIPAAMRMTAEKTAQKLAASVAAGAARPAENGMSKGAPATTKPDPSKYTRADIEDIRRRVAAGERITL